MNVGRDFIRCAYASRCGHLSEYTAHIYPGNWSTAFKAQVANAVTKVPVFMTEWGYVLNGTDRNLGAAVTTWGADFRTLVDSEGASWTAWVADNGWQPNMFTSTALTL